MKITIMSQNNDKLITTENIYINGTKIMCECNNHYETLLGNYDTKYRAEEIIKEIRKKMILKYRLDISPEIFLEALETDDFYKLTDEIFYEMPKE